MRISEEQARAIGIFPGELVGQGKPKKSRKTLSDGVRIARKLKQSEKGFSEAQILKFMLDRLEMYRLARRLEYIRLNSGKIKADYKTKAGQFRSRYIKLARRGTADLVIFLSGNHTFFIEAKDASGEQTPEQAQFQHFVESLGYKYYICRNVRDLENALEQEGFRK
jgi:hypothetical protein